MKDYEVIIGLETHIQLNTQTKIFCSCKADSVGSCPKHEYLPGLLRYAWRAARFEQRSRP